MILRITETKAPKRSPLVKCDKCQGYRHIVDKHTNLFRVVITERVPTAAPESGSIIPSVATPVVIELSDVLNKYQDKPPLICDIQPEIESESDEFTYHQYIDFNVNEDIDDDLTDDQDEEALGDGIVESTTLIFSEVTPVITKITDVSLKDNILIKEFIDVFSKTLHPTALGTHF